MKLFLKGGLLALSITLALIDQNMLTLFFARKILFFTVYHLLWLFTVLLLAKSLTPQWSSGIASGKMFRAYFLERGRDTSSKREKLRDYTRRMNIGALKVALFWIAVILAIGLAVHTGFLNSVWLFITVVFFVFMDQFCISVWCVFQELFVRNKCCNTCRIYQWGKIMAVSPLIFVPSFWTYSIVGLAPLLVIQWEYLYSRYPERFHEAYNENLTCRGCTLECKNGRDAKGDRQSVGRETSTVRT